jgi:drug/metabolite transporter (DMT)-like permease
MQETVVLGIVASIVSPLMMVIGFIIWEDAWLGSAYSLNVYKCSIAGSIFLLLSQSIRSMPIDEHYPLIMLSVSSLIGIVIGDNTWLLALQMIGAKHVILIDTLKPFLGALLGYVYLGEPITPKVRRAGKKDHRPFSIPFSNRILTFLHHSIILISFFISSLIASFFPSSLPTLFSYLPFFSVLIHSREMNKPSLVRVLFLCLFFLPPFLSFLHSLLFSLSSSSNKSSFSFSFPVFPTHSSLASFHNFSHKLFLGIVITSSGILLVSMESSEAEKATEKEISSKTKTVEGGGGDSGAYARVGENDSEFGLSSEDPPSQPESELSPPSSPPQTNRTLGYALALINVVLDAIGSLLTKKFGVNFNTLEINYVRFGFAAVFMLCLSGIMHCQRCLCIRWVGNDVIKPIL